jgi:hypothetical protein
MTLSDLSHEQLVALAGLVEAVAISDGTVSEGEVREIGRIADALGDDRYRELLDEAEARFPDVGALKKALAAIRGEDARQLIFGTAVGEALADLSPDHGQSALIHWLAAEWSIQVDMGE